MVKNLKRLRSDKGISQQALVEIICISQQSMNKYENHNIEPDITTLTLLAKYFNTSVDYLIGNTEINHIIEKLEPYELNDDESALINDFRKLNETEKESIKTVIANYLNKK